MRSKPGPTTAPRRRGPLLDQIIKEMVGMRETLMEEMRRIRKQLEVMTFDVMQVRADRRRLEDRMDDLEQKPN